MQMVQDGFPGGTRYVGEQRQKVKMESQLAGTAVDWVFWGGGAEMESQRLIKE